MSECDQETKPTQARPIPSHGPSEIHIAVGLTAASLGLLALKVILQANGVTLEIDDKVSLGLIVVAALPWLATLLSRATFPGGMELVFREQAHLAARQEEVEDRLQGILAAVYTLISREEVELLRGLASSVPVPYSHSDQAHLDAVKAQIRRLRDLGLIRTKKGVGATISAENDGVNLKSFVFLTDEGWEFTRVMDREHSKEG